ncbi:peroxisomal membrane protein PEX16 [Hylaeus volcanicus]|uniref:peroxisomal membrane protein PEX16 n=1 Tax=Hylaeus volcanicus TaxID=313075 RepID=UPI0023B85606|nr:peroxisomal membrane protein PEX16 [Hylaeus volcanicus]
MVLDKVNSSVLKLIEPYKKWVIENPQLLADLEKTVQCLSYFTAGSLNNSTFTSEFIYSFSNLVVLFNDLLMCSGRCMHLKFPQFESKLKIWLTVVEYTETLFEISAKKLWGPSGRWFVITAIQIFKTVLRLLVIHVYKERMVKCPPIQPLNRDMLIKSNEEKLKNGFMLKRSGTIVRSIRGTNSLQARTWERLPSVPSESDNLNASTVSEKKFIIAESLYIMKPLFHLGCVSVTGEKQWAPWLLSFAIDLLSLNVFNDKTNRESFSKEEEEELNKRKLALLLYILRSPFYDKCTRDRINAALTALSTTVPFAKFIAEPMKKYLPHWQSTYFYIWSR